MLCHMFTFVCLFHNKSKKTHHKNEYFEFSFIVNEMFQKFVSCESSDGILIKTRLEIFPLPFKHLTFELLNVCWVALRAQVSYKF